MSYGRLAVYGTGAAYAGRALYRHVKTQYGSTKKKVISVDRRLQKIERGYNKELKTHDVSAGDTPDTTGAVVGLTLIGQGDTSLAREGLQIRPRGLEFKIHAVINASATATTSRVIIFVDTQQQGTLPPITELLEGDSFVSFPEHDSRPRFKIKKDYIITQSINGHKRNVFIKGYIKFPKNAKIWYSGTDNSQGSQGKNNIYVYRVSSEATNKPTVNFYSRLRFTE